MLRTVVQGIYEQHQKEAGSEAQRNLISSLNEKSSVGFKSGSVILYELIQNADDSLTELTPVSVTILLTKRHLVFSHTGGKFSDTDVSRLCRLGDISNKEKSTARNKSGYKGLGFKSVFVVSDEVTIISDDNRFQFSKQKTSDKLPWQLIPIWVADQPIPTELATHVSSPGVHIILKINRTDELRAELDGLKNTPEHLLFLRRVNQISWEVRSPSPEKNTLLITKNDATHTTTFTINGQAQPWYVFPVNNLPIPADIQQELRKMDAYECPARLATASTTSLTFAAKIDKDGKITSTLGRIFATLPLLRFDPNLPFLINAEFLPDTGRTNLILNPWNQFLWRVIAYQHLNFVAAVANQAAQRSCCLRLLGQLNDKAFATSWQQGFNEGLQTIPFIPEESSTSSLLLASEAITDPNDFFHGHHIPYEGLRKLVAGALDDVDKLKKLGIPAISETDLLQGASRYLAKVKDPKIHRKVLLSLSTLAKRKMITNDDVKKFPLFACTDGAMAKSTEHVYVGETTSAELTRYLSLKFIIPEILLADERGLEPWLDELGIKKANHDNIIQCGLHFLKSNPSQREFILKFTRYLFALFNEDYFVNRHDIWVRICIELPVLTRQSSNIATQCYLANDYDPEQRLQNDLPQLDRYVTSEYLTDQNEKSRWRQFFLALGVADKISLIIKKDYKRGQASKQHPYLASYISRYLDNAGDREERPLSLFVSVTFIDLLLKPSCAASYEKYFWRAVTERFTELADVYHKPVDYKLKDGKVKPNQGSAQIPTFIKHFFQTQAIVLAKDGKRHPANELYLPELEGVIEEKAKVASLPVSLTHEQATLLGFKVCLTPDQCLHYLERLAQRPQPSYLSYVTIFKMLFTYPENEIQAKCQAWGRSHRLPSQNNQMQFAKDLQIVRTADFDYPPNANEFLKQFDGLTHDELLRLAKLFGMNIRDQHTLQIEIEEGEEDTELKNRLSQLIGALSIVKSHVSGTNLGDTFSAMTSAWQRLTIIRAAAIKQTAGTTRTLRHHVSTEPPILYYQHHKHFTRNPVTAKREILSWLVDHLVKSLALPTLNGLADFIKSFLDHPESVDIREWLTEKGFNATPLPTLTIQLNDVPPMAQAVAAASMPQAQNPIMPLAAAANEEPPAALSSTAEVISAMAEDNPPNPKPSKPPKAELAPFSFSYMGTRVDPFFKPAKTHLVEPTGAVPSSQPAAKRHEYPVNSKDAPTDPQTIRERTAIGNWGEIAVFAELMRKYQRKAAANHPIYQGCEVIETVNGFAVKKIADGAPVLELVWCNKSGMTPNVTCTESGSHYDMKLVKYFKKSNGSVVSCQRDITIEVKSTRSTRVAPATFKSKEVQVMQSCTIENHAYHVYRLYGAGTMAGYQIKKYKNLPSQFPNDEAPVFELQLLI